MRDLIVIGGGPAGLATAIFAAMEGLSVTLLERGVLPIDKPCGEGLMPSGVRLLEEMGARIGDSHPFRGIRYIDGDRVAEACFAAGRGLGIRRSELSVSLTARAREVGVEVRERSPAEAIRSRSGSVLVRAGTDTLEASFVAAADGLGSRIRRMLHVDATPRQPRMKRYGFRRRFRIRPWTHFVEVHWARGAEAYVTPVSEEEVGVALLWHERAPSYQAMLSRFPALQERLRGASPTSRLAGAGPFRRKSSRVVSGRVALVGDAAGYCDAITGEGVALGFRSAQAFVSVLKHRTGLEPYEAAYRDLSRRYRMVTELVITLAAHPRLRRRVVATFSENPELFERFLAIYHDQAPWSSLGARGLYRLLAGNVIE